MARAVYAADGVLGGEERLIVGVVLVDAAVEAASLVEQSGVVHALGLLRRLRQPERDLLRDVPVLLPRHDLHPPLGAHARLPQFALFFASFLLSGLLPLSDRRVLAVRAGVGVAARARA